MLGKLLKYDLVAVGRILLPVHGLAALLALGAAGCFAALEMAARYPMSAAGGAGAAILVSVLSITGVMCLMSLLAAPIATFVVLVWRFYRNLLTDEGYLTLTLPAPASAHLASKTVVGVLWLAADAAVVLAGAAVAIFGAMGFDFGALREAAGWFAPLFFGPGALFPEGYLASGVVVWAAGQVLTLLIAYLSFLLGGLLASRHKVAAGVGLYFGISWAYGLISSAASLAFAMGVGTPLLGISASSAALIWNVVSAAAAAAICAGVFALCAHLLGRRVELA